MQRDLGAGRGERRLLFLLEFVTNLHPLGQIPRLFAHRLQFAHDLRLGVDPGQPNAIVVQPRLMTLEAGTPLGILDLNLDQQGVAVSPDRPAVTVVRR